ncbi:MAG: hypothetical protein U0457_04640 [Candidatus Sericytochromatia bacterium]
MIDAIKNIMQMINIESSNLAGANVKGYKKKEGLLGSSGTNPLGTGNDLYTRTINSQGAINTTGEKADLAIQGDGYFILFNDGVTSSVDPTEKLANLAQFNKITAPVTAGTFTVNGNNVTVDPANDSINDVLNKIDVATGGTVKGSYDAIQNSITLVNTTGLPGSNIVIGASPSTNFLDVMQLKDAKLQPGSFNQNYLTSTNPIGIPGEFRQLYYTRKGDFHFDNNGYLVNSNGLFVGGIDKRTGEVMKIDKKAYDGSGGAQDDFHFSANGLLFNDTQLGKEGKQIALARFPNAGGLSSSKYGGDILVDTGSSGIRQIATADKSGFGVLQERALEESNSSATESLGNLGFLQRFFPATVNALKVNLSLQDDLNNQIK